MFDYSMLTLAQTAPAEGDRVPVVGGGDQTVGPANTGQTQTTTGAGDGKLNSAPQTPPSNPMWQLLLPLAMIAVFWFIIFAPQRKEKKRRSAMLSALKKGDKVATIGGEIGTVVEVNDQNVLLKVDESSNTRIRYLRSAIQGVIEEKAVETTEKK